MQLWEHEWLTINEVLYKLYSNELEEEPRISLLKLCRMSISYDAAAFFISNPTDDALLSNGIGVEIPQQVIDSYLEEYIDYDYGKWMYMTSESNIFRTSDWFPDNVRESSIYYEKVLKANNLHHELRMSLYYNHVLLGSIAFMRSKSEPDFSDKDIFILNILKKHFALYTYRSILNCCPEDDNKKKEDITKIASEYELTGREEEVLRLLLAGESNVMVAQKLCISPNTQKKHTMNIYKKLNVNNRTELYKKLMG
ncbi:helix-turn-helix transcriptional regulator [Lachnospiraceae bacterium 62-35]